MTALTVLPNIYFVTLSYASDTEFKALDVWLTAVKKDENAILRTRFAWREKKNGSRATQSILHLKLTKKELRWSLSLWLYLKWYWKSCMFLEQVTCFTRFHLGLLAYNAVDYGWEAKMKLGGVHWKLNRDHPSLGSWRGGCVRSLVNYHAMERCPEWIRTLGDINKQREILKVEDLAYVGKQPRGRLK